MYETLIRYIIYDLFWLEHVPLIPIISCQCMVFARKCRSDVSQDEKLWMKKQAQIRFVANADCSRLQEFERSTGLLITLLYCIVMIVQFDSSRYESRLVHRPRVNKNESTQVNRLKGGC